MRLLEVEACHAVAGSENATRGCASSLDLDVCGLVHKFRTARHHADSMDMVGVHLIQLTVS